MTENISVFSNHCCGCGECASTCPAGAIQMRPNYQGFFYPLVDESKCVYCGQCVRNCSFNSFSSDLFSHPEQQAFAVKHRNPDVRAKSRSGGMFTALSDYIIDLGGVVYGCAMVDLKTAEHQRAVTKDQRAAFHGSKYIPSKLFGIYDSVADDLKSGKWVLFSGTACQVNAIRDYCKDLDCSKLLLVDIVCHGTPSPRIWGDYVDYVEKKCGKRIVAVDFRDKAKFGWADHQETFVFEDRTDYSDDIFKSMFYSHSALRKDCFSCPFKNLSRVGDITLADCWGIAEHYPDFDDDKGVSLVLVNTEKGRRFFDASVSEIESLPVGIMNVLQPPLVSNWSVPDNYDRFWAFYDSNTFEKTLEEYVYSNTSTQAYHDKSRKRPFVRIRKRFKKWLHEK